MTRGHGGHVSAAVPEVDAHAERRDGAFSNTGVGANYDKYDYHEPD